MQLVKPGAFSSFWRVGVTAWACAPCSNGRGELDPQAGRLKLAVEQGKMLGMNAMAILLSGLCCCHSTFSEETADRSVSGGPLFSRYRLTLDAGEGTRFLGPFGILEEVWPDRGAGSFAAEEWPPENMRMEGASVSQTARNLTLAPVFSYYTEPPVNARHWDLLYPVVSYDRYGSESRLQVFQLLSLSGGRTQEKAHDRTCTLFPFLFARRSEDPTRDYTAIWPVYGRMENRLFRDETRFALWPLYVQTRKKDVVTDNFVAPFIHVRRGDGLKGWQFWPFFGQETKDFTYRTNNIGELEAVGGHDKTFVLWPFHSKVDSGFGTTNTIRHRALLPFYSFQRSPERDSASYLWPFGLTLSEDRGIGYRQTAFLWPVFICARGPGKHQDRFWPFYGHSRYEELTSRFYFWPLFAQRRISRGPYEKEVDQGALVVFNRTHERNADTGKTQSRIGLWPLFLWKKDWEGLESFQCLAPLSALMPKNASIARTYAPFFALWRTEKNAQTGASSQSFLWNLYRGERTPTTKKNSLLFGLFQYQSGPAGKRVKVFFIPFGNRAVPQEADGPAAR